MSGGGGGSGNDGSNDMQVSGAEAAYSNEKGISTHADTRTSTTSYSGGGGEGNNTRHNPHTDSGSTKPSAPPGGGATSLGSGRDHSFESQHGDRITRMSSGQEPGYRPQDSRPYGLSKEEAYRQGKITVDQRDADPELTEQHERDVTRDLDFEEHWNLAPKALKWSPTLRFLYASGKNIGEWAKNKGWNWNPGTGTITDDQGNNVGERNLMNTAAPEAPGLINNTETTLPDSEAAKWYTNLGNNAGSNPFSFSTAFADAKAKQQTILGNPSAVRQLAVNESPFYNWLKENSLNKGIL